MSRPDPVTVLLLAAGTVAVGIGLGLLAAPVAVHALSGTALPADPALLNEVRAAAGGLTAVGALILAGARWTRLRLAALAAGVALYLGYGLARLVSLVVDGMPGGGLLAAMAIELVVGALAVAALARTAAAPSAARQGRVSP